MRNTLAIATLAIALVTPGVAAAQDHVVGAFLAFDLLTEDLDAAKEFYAGMFGWTFHSAVDPDVAAVMNNGRVIGSMRRHDANADENESQWLGRMSVEDVAEAVEVITGGGGRVLDGPARLGAASIAVVADPQGALFTLYSADAGDQIPDSLDHGDWFWPELWTSDADAAVSFYRDVAGFEARSVDRRYTVMRNNGVALAGIGQAPFEIDAHWLPGILVANLEEAERAVTHLGGEVLIERSDDFGGGASALVQDPTGAVFMIQEWKGSTEAGR